MLSFLNVLRLLPGVEAKVYYSYSEALLFCMTKRLIPASRGKASEDKRKWNLPPAHTECFRKIAKNGEHKLPPEHTFIWRLAEIELEINNTVFPIY